MTELNQQLRIAKILAEDAEIAPRRIEVQIAHIGGTAVRRPLCRESFGRIGDLLGAVIIRKIQIIGSSAYNTLAVGVSYRVMRTSCPFTVIFSYFFAVSEDGSVVSDCAAETVSVLFGRAVSDIDSSPSDIWCPSQAVSDPSNKVLISIIDRIFFIV